jgi:5-formyltetrahydrofolate cyclo-ligase
MDKSYIKKKIRETIWNLMEEKNIASFPRPVFGRIPNFKGAEKAAKLLLNCDFFNKAEVVKVNPDSPQQPVRELVLINGKKLIMPTPRIKEGFILLEPSNISPKFYKKASTIRGAFEFGRKVHPKDLPNIDLIVLGAVAVSVKNGARIGKGEGYGELEYGILIEYGKISNDVIIITTVHEIQLVEDIPVEDFDVSVDYIITPERVIKVIEKHPRPKGIIWNLLNEEKINEIPLLLELKKLKTNNIKFV